MSHSPRRLFLIAGLVVFSAGSLPVPGRAAAFEPPVLGGPEVVKLDWNTRGLVAADFDGDGRTDLALINNDRSRIEMLLQREPGEKATKSVRRVVQDRWEPELEDSRFEKRPLTTGATVHDFAAGDLNGDGRVDLAYTNDPDGLTVRLQSSSGDWDEKQDFDFGQPAHYLTNIRIADLDGDGRDDLVVLMQKELLVLRQTAAGGLAPPSRYAVAEDACFSLELSDVNRDGRTDVLYLAATRRDGLRVRLQQSDGSLGPEIPFELDSSRTALEVIARPAGEPPAFGYVQTKTAMLALFSLVADQRETARLAALKPRVYSTRTGARNNPSYAVNDFNGDGRLDVAVADPDAAQVLVFFQNESGELAESHAFPSLAEVRAITSADWDGDGRAELFFASPKERILGVSTYTSEGRLSYPQPVAVTGKPIAVDAGILTQGVKPSLAVVVEDEGKRNVVLLERDGGAASDTNAGRITQTVELAGLRTDPRAIRLLDANQDGRLDLAVFIPFEAMRLLVQGGDGGFVDLSTAADYRGGLVENLDPASFSLADVDGDGKREMLVGGKGFVRALRVDAAGKLQVVDQFNARDSNADIPAAFAADIDGDGEREVALFDRRAEQLEVLRRNNQGVFTLADTLSVGRIELVGTFQADLEGNGADDLFFFGKDRFWLLGAAAQSYRIDPLRTYETDLKDIRYDDLAVGDLNGDGESDILMIDTRSNLVEVLARDGLELKSVLHFRVFEADPHAQGRGSQSQEPREAMIADLTNDGKSDLILLVHDRVLLYPQE